MFRRLLVSAIFFAVGFGYPTLLHAESAKHLFERVLVIGASISADAYAPSPGKLVAKQAQVAAGNLIVRAKSGKASDYHVKWIQTGFEQLKPSVVFGLDLFEHDVKTSMFLDKKTTNRVREIIDRLCRTSRQVYIGTTIPYGFYLGPFLLNKYLQDLTREYPNLHIVCVDCIYAGLYSGGYDYNVNGVHMKVTKKQALKDNVHPNLFGSTLMANILIQMIRQINTEIDDKDLPYLKVK